MCLVGGTEGAEGNLGAWFAWGSGEHHSNDSVLDWAWDEGFPL